MSKHHRSHSPYLLFGFFLCLIFTVIAGVVATDNLSNLEIVKDNHGNCQIIKQRLLEKNIDLETVLAQEKQKYQETLRQQYDRLKKINQQQKNELIQIKTEFQQSLMQYRQDNKDLISEHQKTKVQLNKKLSLEKDKFENLSANKNSKINNFKTNNDNLRLKIKNLRDFQAITSGESEETQRTLKKKITVLKLENFKLNDTLIKSKIKPAIKSQLVADGLVINTQASLKTNKISINLGEKDHVTNGLCFTIYNQGKGGQQKPKGKLEVIHVGLHTSFCLITELKDKSNPIIKGDVIANNNYRND